MLLNTTTTLLQSCRWLVPQRGLARIPWWEYHLRFDPNVGRKVPAKDVLDRFKRLNNGMWVRTQILRTKTRYLKKGPELKENLSLVTCTREECEILDKMMTPFHLRPKYYIEDPYEPYHVRHGLQGENAPRVGYNKQFLRERPKILLEDSVADKHFHDR